MRGDAVAGLEEPGRSGDGPVAHDGKGGGKKTLHNASTKVAVVVERMLLPLLDTPLRSHVTFVPVDEQSEFDLMEEVERRRPDVMSDAAAFRGHFQSLYERYMYFAHGYAAVPTSDSRAVVAVAGGMAR